MNIVRALLGGLLVTALVAGCGSDSGSGSGNAAFSKCATGSSSSSACTTCEQDKCGSELNKCYGANFSGGACADLISCAEKSSDPCKATNCQPSGDCSSCITGTLVPCVLKNCSDCSGGSQGTGGSGNSGAGGSGNVGTGATPGTGATTGTGSATCSDLGTCCGKVSDATLKSECQMLVDAKNDTVCNAAYGGFKSLCN